MIWIGVVSRNTASIVEANAFVAFNIITSTVATASASHRGAVLPLPAAAAAGAAALAATRGRMRLLIMSRAASPAATVGSPSTMSIKQLKGKAGELDEREKKKESSISIVLLWLNANLIVFLCCGYRCYTF